MRNSSAESLVRRALDAGQGILRMAPAWVPRSFLHPGRRLKLHPNDYYALGAERGGIVERWLSSTTPAANENRAHDEGLSYIESEGERVTLEDAVKVLGADLVGDAVWNEYGRWPVFSKLFDNMGPIPLHLHQNAVQAKELGLEGKPEGYYFPPQLNNVGNNFPFTFFGLEPGTSKADVRRCLENWDVGDNGILDLSKAYRLELGTGWLIGPCLLHAPGSLLTYEPQWGSDVFAMYQSLLEGRVVPWELLVKDVPPEKHQDLDFLVDLIDWEANIDPRFKENHYLEPIVDESNSCDGCTDRWIVYGSIDSEQPFTAKEITVEPGARVTIRDNGASGLLCVQGHGKIGTLALESPALIRFGQMTDDEVFITDAAAREGYTIENHSDRDPLVALRYFGPEVNPQAQRV